MLKTIADTSPLGAWATTLAMVATLGMREATALVQELVLVLVAREVATTPRQEAQAVQQELVPALMLLQRLQQPDQQPLMSQEAQALARQVLSQLPLLRARRQAQPMVEGAGGEEVSETAVAADDGGEDTLHD